MKRLGREAIYDVLIVLGGILLVAYLIYYVWWATQPSTEDYSKPSIYQQSDDFSDRLRRERLRQERERAQQRR